MNFQPKAIEYNTEAIASTFDLLSEINDTAFHNTALTIDGPTFEKAMIRSLQRMGENLVAHLSSKAVHRVLRSERSADTGPAMLIGEVVTEKSIRKGFISETGRRERIQQISQLIDRHGAVDFAILLLPFRTSSPLKNRGTLPDMGEFYALEWLHSLSRACHDAQIKMAKLIEDVGASVGNGVLDCAQYATSGGETNIRPLAMAAAQECEKTIENRKEKAAACKFLRKTADLPVKIRVQEERTFISLLVKLAVSAIPLDVWLAFKDAPVVPVRILACRDAGRYPCFDDVSSKQIKDYGNVLCDAVKALGLDERFLKLIDYAVIKRNIYRAPGYRESVRYFEARKIHFLDKIEMTLPAVWASHGRNQLISAITEVDEEGVLTALFEPLLFSLEHREIYDFARNTDQDHDRLYIELMQTIYQPARCLQMEQLRQKVIANSLKGAALYCAAYEANTASKNPTGFDDVAAVFPDALRMSIHHKPESVGHFSINVSPSRNRTPWHGTAHLGGGRVPDELTIATDLAELLESRGERPVVVCGAATGLLAHHVRSGQPIVYLSPALDITEPQELLPLLEGKTLVANG